MRRIRHFAAGGAGWIIEAPALSNKSNPANTRHWTILGSMLGPTLNQEWLNVSCLLRRLANCWPTIEETSPVCRLHPANARRWNNVDLKLGERRRRSPVSCLLGMRFSSYSGGITRLPEWDCYNKAVARCHLAETGQTGSRQLYSWRLLMLTNVLYVDFASSLCRASHTQTTNLYKITMGPHAQVVTNIIYLVFNIYVFICAGTQKGVGL